MPVASLTAIMTGGNTPGMLDEAIITSRNSGRADSPPVAAMAPRFQTTVSLLSRSVVATSKSRPLTDSRDLLDHRICNQPVDQLPERLSLEERCTEQAQNAAPSNQTIAAITDERVGQLRIPFRSEESKRRNQRACTDAGHQFELGSFVCAIKSHQGARAESAAGAAARKGEDVQRAVGRSGPQTSHDIRRRPIEPPIHTKSAYR